MSKIWLSSFPGAKGIPGVPLKEDRIYYLNTDTLDTWMKIDIRIWIKLMSNVGRNEFRIKGGAIRATGCFFFKEGILRAIGGENPQDIASIYRVLLPSRGTRKFHLKVKDNKLWVKFAESKVKIKHEEIFEITKYISKIYNRNELKKLVNTIFTRIWKEFK